MKKEKFKKIICFDLDNVICNTRGKNYKNATPNKIGIKKINELFKKGYMIKLFTGIRIGLRIVICLGFVIPFISTNSPAASPDPNLCGRSSTQHPL